MQERALEARWQGAVADVGDHRRVYRLTAERKGGVGHTRLDIAQAQLAPLADGVAIAVGQGAVVGACDRLAVLLQGDGIVGSGLDGDAHGALGETGAVVEDGALQPVFPAVGGVAGAVALVVAPQRRACGAFTGVPVAGGAGQALAVDEAAGLRLLAAGFEGEGDEGLALRIGLGHGGKGTDG
ncbi:hypothetical protein D3C80_1380630 [compost metagenome]